MERSEIERALARVGTKACQRRQWMANHAIAHVEAELFGYDPGCDEHCPLD